MTTWTLWLITAGTILGQGASTAPLPTPIATYNSHDDCIGSISYIYADVESVYGKKNTPKFPGFFFCVQTIQRK